jgi:hypothetical protein
MWRIATRLDKADVDFKWDRDLQICIQKDNTKKSSDGTIQKN